MKHSVLLSAFLIILSAPINLFSQSVPILYEVNMSYQIDQNQFDLETLQFWQDFNANLKAANPDAFAVGEAWEPTNIALQYVK